MSGECFGYASQMVPSVETSWPNTFLSFWIPGKTCPRDEMGQCRKRHPSVCCQHAFSLRAGGATALLASGLDWISIQRWDRWRSFIFHEYIWHDADRFLHFGEQIANTSGLNKYLIEVSPQHTSATITLPPFHTGGAPPPHAANLSDVSRSIAYVDHPLRGDFRDFVSSGRGWLSIPLVTRQFIRANGFYVDQLGKRPGVPASLIIGQRPGRVRKGPFNHHSYGWDSQNPHGYHILRGFNILFAILVECALGEDRTWMCIGYDFQLTGGFFVRRGISTWRNIPYSCGFPGLVDTFLPLFFQFALRFVF